MIKYPDKITKTYTKVKNFANRGMTLESEINDTNQYYLDNNIAVIYKKPTPIGIVEQKNGKISNAFFLAPSTTDYNGIYMRYYVDFEAKETNSKTSFPLSNIHKHQIEHMKRIIMHKGICFLVVRFNKLNMTYLLFANDFIEYIDNNERKSIPIGFFKEKGYIIENKLKPLVDYISILKEYGGINNEKEYKREIK